MTTRKPRRCHFGLYQDGVGQWRWRLTDTNNEIVGDSGEGYVSEANARRAVANVKACVATAIVVRVQRAR